MNDQLNRLMASIDVGVIFINRLSELGQQVGSRVLDVLVLREKGMKREVRVLNILLFVKSVLWKVRPFRQLCFCLILCQSVLNTN